MRVFLSLLIILSLPVFAQVAELETARDRYAEGVRKIEAENQAAVKAAAGRYQNVLERMQEAAIQQGNLDGVQAVRNELAGLETGNLPEPAPAVLKQVREAYANSLVAAERERQQKQQNYRNAYAKHLAAMVTKLTQDRRIDDALVVRAEIEAIEKDLPPVPEPVPSQPAEVPAQQPVPKTGAQPTARTSKPIEGRDWVSPSTGMEFVWIKALKCWVAKYEVTNGEYRKMKPDHDSKEFGGHSLNGDRQPVVQVNFDDAKAYAKWLNEQDKAALGNLRYRLPTEDEFMTYAQCGHKWEYPWGDGWPPVSGKAGNYHGHEGAGPSEKISGYNDGYPVTCNVEQSWENPWCLYGVGGNVWEACASSMAADQPFGAWRGASWLTRGIQGHLRCALRSGHGAARRYIDSGFRVVLSR